MFGSNSRDAERRLDGRLISQHHMTAAMEAIRTSFLANGGALLAAMTFLSEKAVNLNGYARYIVPLSFVVFVFGIILSILAAIAMWSHQDEVENWLINQAESKRPVKGHSKIRCLLRFALGFFGIGMLLAAISVYLISGPVAPT